MGRKIFLQELHTGQGFFCHVLWTGQFKELFVNISSPVPSSINNVQSPSQFYRMVAIEPAAVTKNSTSIFGMYLQVLSFITIKWQE